MREALQAVLENEMTEFPGNAQGERRSARRGSRAVFFQPSVGSPYCRACMSASHLTKCKVEIVSGVKPKESLHQSVKNTSYVALLS